MTLAVQLCHAMGIVTAIGTKLFAIFHGAKAGSMRTFLGPVGLVSFSK
jgi:hypothetical protein